MLAFPAPLALLIALGILSAELSTADSLFGSLATCTVNDLYKKWLSRIVHDSSSEDFHAKVEKVSNRLIRVVLFVICIGAALISLERPTSLTLLTHIGTSAILAGLIAPISFAYWSKDCSKLAAIAGFISGVGCLLPRIENNNSTKQLQSFAHKFWSVLYCHARSEKGGKGVRSP